MTSSDGNRGGLENLPYSFRKSREGKVFISWGGKQVMILTGKKAESFLTRITGLAGLEEQLVMARITGNFKRGNER